MTIRLEISLFGTCAVRVAGPEPIEIRSAKHRALLSILATAPLGRRTRGYLQATLWGESDYDSGHQNLRRALSDLRKAFGSHFDTLIHTTNSDVELDLEHVHFVGDPSRGLFLEDLDLRERGYREWVGTIRQNPGQIAALYRNAPRSRMRRPRPKVTVIPLASMGTDPALAVLGDWVAEQSCRFLSRSNLISVISHLSSRAVSQGPIVIPNVRERLDVDYVLTGAILPKGNKIACDFDFIEADSGQILWNRHIEVDAADAPIQLSERLEAVVQAVARAIAESALSATRLSTIAQIEDHNLVIAGVTRMHRRTMRDFLRSREYLEEATQRMPNLAEPHAWLAKWHVLNVFKGFSVDRETDTRKALDCTARALDINPESSFGLTIDGFANNNLLKNMDVASKRYEAALEINPNACLAWLLRGSLSAFKDDGEGAIEQTRYARKLSPIDPFGYYFDSLSSTACLAAEHYEDALEFAERSLDVNDRHLSTLRAKITALHFLGREEEARATAMLLRRRHPDFSIDDYKRTHPGAQNRAGQRVIAALESAGIN